MRLLRHDTLLAAPWKNGGGETRQIACHPPGASLDDFNWRLSTATVAQDGAFSTFEGIDRRLYILKGAGLNLHFDSGRACRIGIESHIDFRGEDAVHGSLVDGPVVDFNIMVRRNAQRAHIQQMMITGARMITVPWKDVAVFVRSGQVNIADTALRVKAQPFDTVRLDDGHAPAISVGGDATIILIGFDPV